MVSKKWDDKQVIYFTWPNVTHYAEIMGRGVESQNIQGFLGGMV